MKEKLSELAYDGIVFVAIIKLIGICVMPCILIFCFFFSGTDIVCRKEYDKHRTENQNLLERAWFKTNQICEEHR